MWGEFVLERFYVSIAAVSEEPVPLLKENSKCFIDKLIPYRDRIVFVLGGYWGLMKYIADYALDRGFTVVFILPSNPPTMPPNTSNSIIIQTDLGFQSRSTIMCKTGNVLVAMGGRIGSLLEILLAYDYGKPIIVVKSGYETDKIPECFGEYIDVRKRARIMLVENGCSAAKKVISIMKELNKLREEIYI